MVPFLAFTSKENKYHSVNTLFRKGKTGTGQMLGHFHLYIILSITYICKMTLKFNILVFFTLKPEKHY